MIGDEHAQAVQQALRTTRTLLFVGAGAGLEDPNFSAFLAWSGRVFASDEYRHFVLVRDNEAASVQAAHPPEQRIFALGSGAMHADLPAFLRQLAPLAPPPTSTPLPATGTWASLPNAPHCVGRDHEVQSLVDLLTSTEVRPVAVLGAPGIGKSTIALAALHDPAVVGAFAMRRQFVRCDTAASAEALAALVAPSLGLPLTAQVEDALCAELSTAPAMLVLDNLETPWQADTLGVERLLSRLVSLAGVRIVAGLRGTVRPLLDTAVQWADPVEPRSLALPDAKAMFLAIAGNGYEEDPALDDLLIPLEGVPLAINLMACVAQGQPLTEVCARWLDERTSMLRRADASHPRLNLEISYEVSIRAPGMDDVSRRLLSTLAKFPGGVAQSDLSSVFPTDTFRAAGVLRQLALAFDEGSRLRLLAPLREYVDRQYPPTDDDWRMANVFYLELATRQSAQVGHPGGAEAVRALLPETSNIQVSMLGRLRDDMTPLSAEVAAAIQAAIVFADFERFTGQGDTGALLRAASVAHSAGDSSLEGRSPSSGKLGAYSARPTASEASARSPHGVPTMKRPASTLTRRSPSTDRSETSSARPTASRASGTSPSEVPTRRGAASASTRRSTSTDRSGTSSARPTASGASARSPYGVPTMKRPASTLTRRSPSTDRSGTSSARPTASGASATSPSRVPTTTRPASASKNRSCSTARSRSHFPSGGRCPGWQRLPLRIRSARRRFRRAVTRGAASTETTS